TWAQVGFALALLLVVISPARPLWPAGWFLKHYGPQLESSRLGSRAMAVYGVYGGRADAFGPVIQALPGDASVLGVVTSDDPETSLWRPFGSRRILHVLAREPAEEIRRRGIKYVLVKVEKLGEPWDEWLRRVDARVLQTFELKLRAGEKPSQWRLVELNPGSSLQSGSRPL